MYTTQRRGTKERGTTRGQVYTTKASGAPRRGNLNPRRGGSVGNATGISHPEDADNEC